MFILASSCCGRRNAAPPKNYSIHIHIRIEIFIVLCENYIEHLFLLMVFKFVLLKKYILCARCIFGEIKLLKLTVQFTE